MAKSNAKKKSRLHLTEGGFVPAAEIKKQGIPYREGTKRYKSMALIVKKPGITREEYLKKGGSPVELIKFNHWGVVKHVG